LPRADNVRLAGDVLEWTYGSLQPDEITLEPFTISGLAGFLALGQPGATDEQILDFAREWGPLGLYPLPTKTPDRWTREPLHVWRTHAGRSVAYLRLACRLRSRHEEGGETDLPGEGHGDWQAILDEGDAATLFSDPAASPEDLLTKRLDRERAAAGIRLVFEVVEGSDAPRRYGISRHLQVIEDELAVYSPGVPRLPLLEQLSHYPAGLEPGLAEFRRHLEYVRSPWQQSVPEAITASRIEKIDRLRREARNPPSATAEPRPSWLWSAALVGVISLVASGANHSLCVGCGRLILDEDGSAPRMTPALIWCRDRNCVRRRHRLRSPQLRPAPA
jgi:hypothetical protein